MHRGSRAQRLMRLGHRADGKVAYMGQMRFVTPRRELLPSDALERAYLVGIDGVPWRTKVTWTTNELSGPAEFIADRSVRESSSFVIPWRIEGYGEPLLTTTSLMERPEPYQLPVELARGSVNRVRNQLAEWEACEIVFPAEVRALLKGATSHFIRAATSQASPLQASMEAQQAITLAAQASELMCNIFSEKMIERRRQQTMQLPTLFAGAVSPVAPKLPPEFVAAFNTTLIPLPWRDIEAIAGKPAWEPIDQLIEQARNHGLRICAGPLMALDKLNIPDWVYLWEDDFDHLQTCLLSQVRATTQRLRGKVHVWNVAARVNVRGALDVSEEQNLRLIVGAIDTVRSIDSRTPMVLSVDQPWADYLAADDSELSPLHFADSLARADLGLSGLGLEINLGYWPGGTLTRDVMELSRQIDRWSILGLPLLIFLSVPSSNAPDPQARHASRVLDGCLPHGISLESHQAFVSQIIKMLLSKNTVQGILWNEYSDALPHDFAHAGLFDSQGTAKPVLGMLRQLRQQFLA